MPRACLPFPLWTTSTSTWTQLGDHIVKLTSKTLWLELLHSFATVKNLCLSRKLRHISCLSCRSLSHRDLSRMALFNWADCRATGRQSPCRGYPLGKKVTGGGGSKSALCTVSHSWLVLSTYSFGFVRYLRQQLLFFRVALP